jgi:FKBP-type peptidyl-prolyl cis-trans isomerase
MRQSAFVFMLVIASVLLAAQANKPATSAQKPGARTSSKRTAAATASPSPSTTPSKVSGPPHTTASGVKYWDITVGTGAEAVKGKKVSILYVGWLVNGKEFGGTDDPDIPLELTIGNGMQIKGWDEGITGMRVGGKRQLRIPASAAYGAKGAPPKVPPNAPLIMDVQLVDVK